MSTRLPSQISLIPSGGANPKPILKGGRIPAPQQITPLGPAQGMEQFNSKDLPPAVNRALNQMQRYVQQALQQIKSNPFANSILIKDISFVNGSTKILNHGLARAFRGCFLVTPRFPASAGVAVILLGATQPDPKTQIAIFSDGTFTSDLLVF